MRCWHRIGITTQHQCQTSWKIVTGHNPTPWQCPSTYSQRDEGSIEPVWLGDAGAPSIQPRPVCRPATSTSSVTSKRRWKVDALQRTMKSKVLSRSCLGNNPTPSTNVASWGLFHSGTGAWTTEGITSKIGRKFPWQWLLARFQLNAPYTWNFVLLVGIP